MLYLLGTGLFLIGLIILTMALMKVAKESDEKSELMFNTYREKNN